MGVNKERNEHLIQREISLILRDMNDKNLQLLSITAVKLTNDSSIATVYFRHNDGDEGHKHLEALEHAKGHIKSELASKIEMRKIPNLEFKYDDSLDYGNKIDQILNNLEK